MKTLAFIIIFICVIFSPPELYGNEKVMNILYTGSMQGELGPCGCSPKTDFGGIARFAHYISHNKQILSPYILIDSGNFSGEDSLQGMLKTEAMLRAFGVMGYDAVGLQNRDKGIPHNFIEPLLKELNLPVISDTDPGKKSRTLKIDGFDVHISSDPGYHKEDMLNILLIEELTSSERMLNAWDVIIMSSGEVLEEPRKHGKTIIVSGYPKGKRLGVLTLSLLDNGKVKDFDHRWELLDSDASIDERVRAILDDYDTEVAQLLKNREEPPQGTGYVGATRCAQCHQTFMESWKATRHAQAFSSLENVGKASDPECVACHSVGFGEQGGFYTLETTPSLANVQCESCHGLNRDHIEDYTVPMKRVTAEDCRTCHTPDNSPEFNYSKYRELIKH